MSKNLLLFLERLGEGLRTIYTLPQETGTQKTGLACMNVQCVCGGGQGRGGLTAQKKVRFLVFREECAQESANPCYGLSKCEVTNKEIKLPRIN